MAYDSPKAIHIDAEIGGKPVDPRHTIDLRWYVARYLESQGVANLFSESQRSRAREILAKWSDHEELINLSGRGQITFSLNYPPIERGWSSLY